MRLYMDVIPKADDAYVRELIEIGQRDLNAAGITCVHSDDLKVIAGWIPFTSSTCSGRWRRRGS